MADTGFGKGGFKQEFPAQSAAEIVATPTFGRDRSARPLISISLSYSGGSEPGHARAFARPSKSRDNCIHHEL